MSNYTCYGPVNPIKLKAVNGLPERTCYDFYEGKNERRSTDDPHQFLLDALTNKDQMLLWAQLAYQIFKSEPETCWNHSNKSWDENFGKNPNNMDLIDCLCHKYDKTKGADGDPHMSTGLVTAGCLDDVEQAAGKLIEQLLKRKLKANDFIKRCPIEALHGKTDKQQVFYTLAAHLDKYGGTQQFCYNVFGLAFYNFRLKVVSDGTTPYNTAIGNREIRDAIKEGGIPGFTYHDAKKDLHTYSMENRSRLEAAQTATLETSVTETDSNSITNAKEYSYTESLGLDVKVGEILRVCEITVQMGFEASQVIQTAYTQDHEVSDSNSSSSSAEVILPPHTSIMVRKMESGAVTTLEYDCPVMVQFDVAVISMCGTFYDDNAAVQAFSTAGYDQRSYYTLFTSAESGAAGEDAAENLYMRYTKGRTSEGYDKTHGETELKTHKKGKQKDYVDWNVIEKQPAASTSCKRDGESKAVETQKANELPGQIGLLRPMSPTGGKLTEKASKISTIIDDPIPLFPLNTIQLCTGANVYNMGVGDVLYPKNWMVEGYDGDNIPFYGFKSWRGEWILVNEDGEQIKDGTIAEIRTEKLTNNVYIIGKAAGVVYAKYLIPEDFYTCSDGTAITNDSIEQTVFIKIEVHDTRLEGCIKVEGSLNVINGTVTNLEKLNGENVHVYDEIGREITVPVIWRVAPGCGNNIVIRDNLLMASAVGTYRIQAEYESLVSDYLEVHVTE